MRLLLVLLFFLGWSGCRRATSLTFAVGGAPNEIEFMERLVDEFESETGIVVNVRRQPTDTDQRRQELVIAMGARESDPDVFLMDVIWVPQFAASGWLEPLDEDAWAPEDLRAFFPEIVRRVDRWQGRLLALPVYVDGGLLYYRRDLLEAYQFGVPRTWNEFVRCAMTIQAKMRAENPMFQGFVWQGAQYEGLVCCFLEFATSRGGGIEMGASGPRVDIAENREALEFMRDLIVTFGISPENTFTEFREEEVRAVFQAGNALFERNWPYAWALSQSEGSPVRGKVGMAPLPFDPNGRPASALGGWHVGISMFSDRKEDARKLVRFLLSYDVQRRLAQELGWNPGRTDVYEDERAAEDFPQLLELREIFEHLVPRPVLPYYSQVSEVLQRYINGVLSGRIEAAQALARAQRKIDEIHGVYGR